jgi:hypothetical protein
MIVLDLDPNVVQPGWTPLIITVVLGIAVVLLYFSMRRQFRKINIPPPETDQPDPDPVEAPTPAPVEPTTGSST